MAIEHFLRTVQLRSVQTVHRIHDSLKSRPEVAQMVQPTEIYRSVEVTDAESEDREEASQNGTQKHGDLNVSEKLTIMFLLGLFFDLL